MSGYSPVYASIAGLKLLRERPKLLPWLALVQMVGYGVLTLVVTAVGGDAYRELVAMQSRSDVDPETAAAVLAAALPALLIAVLLSVILNAVVACAVLRRWMQPPPHRFGGVRLGAAELRVAGALLALMAIYFVSFVLTMVMVMTPLALFSTPGLASVLGVLAGFLVVAFAAARLSPTAAATFHRGRLSIRAAWAMTRGRFWPIFAAHALAVLIVVVTLLLVAIIFICLASVVLITTGQGGLGDVGAIVQNGQNQEAGGLGVVLAAIWQALYLLLAAGAAVIVMGPGYEAYRVFSAEPPPR